MIYPGSHSNPWAPLQCLDHMGKGERVKMADNRRVQIILKGSLDDVKPRIFSSVIP
jgi:hypothetical protein